MYKCKYIFFNDLDELLIQQAELFSKSYSSYFIIPGSVPPRTSAWLEDRDKVAVCKAEEGKPAANISWSYGSNLSSVLTRPGPDGSFTVESRLELTEGMDPKHLTCIIRHLFWKEKDVVLGIKRKKGQTSANKTAKEKNYRSNKFKFLS